MMKHEPIKLHLTTHNFCSRSTSYTDTSNQSTKHLNKALVWLNGSENHNADILPVRGTFSHYVCVRSGFRNNEQLLTLTQSILGNMRKAPKLQLFFEIWKSFLKSSFTKMRNDGSYGMIDLFPNKPVGNIIRTLRDNLPQDMEVSLSRK